MRKMIPVMLILMAGALGTGSALAASEKKDSGKPVSSSSSNTKGGNAYGADDKASAKAGDQDSKDDKKEEQKESNSGKQNPSSASDDAGDKHEASKETDGKDAGEHHEAHYASDERKDHESGDAGVPGFGDDNADEEIEFEVQDLDEHAAAGDEPAPTYYEPESEHHDAPPAYGYEDEHKGEFGWEMAHHVLTEGSDDAGNPEYGHGPGKLDEHYSLRCDDDFVNVHPTPTPVPAAVWMLGSGIAALAVRRRPRA